MAFYSPISAPGQQVAPDTTYFTLGVDGAGVPTTLTGSGTAGTTGTAIMLGTTTAEANEIVLQINVASTTVRYRVEIGIGSGLSPMLTGGNGIVISGSIGGSGNTIRLPLNVPNGSDIYARVAASATTNNTVFIAARFRVKQALEFAGFLRADGLAVDTTTGTTGTRANTNDVTMVGVGSTSFTNLLGGSNLTTTAYGGLIYYLAAASALPASTQGIKLSIAKGAASSEVVIDDLATRVTTGVYVIDPRIINAAIPSNTRLSARILTTTPGTDAMKIGLMGLVP